MAKQQSYQALSAELEKILDDLQQPDVDVDEALKLYERGQLLVQELEKCLKTAENKITKLKSE